MFFCEYCGVNVVNNANENRGSRLANLFYYDRCPKKFPARRAIAIFRWLKQHAHQPAVFCFSLFIVSCDIGVTPEVEWHRYREAKLLFSNIEGVNVNDLMTGRTTVVAKNGDIIDYNPPANGNSRSNAGEARWSPDGRKIVYVEGDGGTDYSQLTVMDSDGRNKRVIVSEGIPSEPNWSPDGLEIVYQRSPAKFGANYEIFVIKADGTNERQLTNRQGWDGLPDFSRDGQKIVFSSETTDTVYTIHLFMINKDGSGLEQLTRRSDSLRNATGPSWSPLSEEIVFSGRQNDDFENELYLISLPSRLISQLTLRTASGNHWDDNNAPRWSNDGQLILYYQYPNSILPGSRPPPSVWIMRPDGTDQKRIIENAKHPDLYVRLH